MSFNAYPIVSGIRAMGLRGAVTVFVSSDIAAGILDAAPHTAAFRVPDDIAGDPYLLGDLMVTFQHDATLPFRTLALTRYDRFERYSLQHVLALGM